MLNREGDYDPGTSNQDLWTVTKHVNGMATYDSPYSFCNLYPHPAKVFRYTNMINNERLYTKPPKFRGGILADPMGLGKSLIILSLIATDPRTKFRQPASIKQSSGTLLIVPPARKLFQAWA